MLAYAANNRPAGRSGSPRTLVLIIAGHAVLIAAVMAAKMEVIGFHPQVPTTIVNIPIEPPPPPTDPQQPTPPRSGRSTVDHVPPIADTPIPAATFDPGPTTLDPVTIIAPDPGPSTVVAADPPIRAPVKLGPRIATSEALLRPPYPAGKQREGEEATLRLRLTIDARGRVTAVEPVGAADPAFLDAARRHIIRAWKYKPATADGVAMPSTTVITLSFRLEDA